MAERVRRDDVSYISSRFFSAKEVIVDHWVAVKGYEDFYKISDSGKIRNKYGRLLKCELNQCGYQRVRLSKNGLKKTYSVHRLVAMHFLLPVKGKNEVNHKDGDKFNNHVDNLEYVNRSENIKHSFYELNLDCLGNGHGPITCITLGIYARSFNEMGYLLEEKGIIPNRGSFQVKCSRKKRRGISHFQFYGYDFEMV